MGENELVEVLRDVVDAIKKDRGGFRLFMLLRDPEDTGTYTICASSLWLEQISPKEGIMTVYKYVSSILGREGTAKISRITIISIDDGSVKMFNRAFWLEDSTAMLINQGLWGVTIPWAVVYESNSSA